MKRIKGDLLDLCKAILRILVKTKRFNLPQKKLGLRLNHGPVEDVDALSLPQLFCLTGCYSLDIRVPLQMLSAFDGHIHVLLVGVRGVL